MLLRFELTFLRSRVARRMFGLFVIAALIPIVATAVIALRHVTGVLSEESQQQLHQASKAYGNSVYERLLFVQDNLREITIKLRNGLDPVNGSDDYLKNQLAALALMRSSGDLEPLLSEMSPPPAPGPTAREHLAAGESVLVSATRPGGAPLIYMSHLIDRHEPGRGLVVAELNPGYLWGNKETFPFTTDFCILDDATVILFCSQSMPESVPDQIASRLTAQSSGPLTWQDEEERFLASYWAIFLKPQFSTGSWTAVASRPETQALAAIAAFRSVFPPIIFLSIVVVIFLSMTQIRKTMVPLERLIAGTRRIGNREFDSRVRIESGDEFEELAQSFNTMADRLGKLFNTVATLSEVDRLILSAPNVEPVLQMVLNRIPKIVPCDFISLTVVDKDSPDIARTFIEVNKGERFEITRVKLTAEEIRKLKTAHNGITMNTSDAHGSYLESLRDLGARSFFVFPIVVKDALSGMIAMGYRDECRLGTDERGQIRDFADRVAVATSAAEREEQLYRQAHYDPLTSLPNRQLFKDRLGQELAHAKRDNCMGALLFIDLDHFKHVNDSKGHSAGDQLLEMAADRLKHCVRETDTVARLGGDEFTIVLSRIADATEASRVATNVIDLFSKPFLVDGCDHYVGASIGVTVFPNDGTTVEELLKNADTAMYRAKETGRGTGRFFINEMNADELERLELETKLRRALERNEFVLHYQPQVDMHTGRVVSCEALIRWPRADGSFTSPEQFISLAEKTGLIVPIGEWTLREACAQFLRWQSDGISLKRVAVNVSTRQFRQNDFLEIVQEIVTDAGMPPDALEIEITESLLADSVDNTITILTKLHEMGLRVSIDDFCTGYSSLSYLKNFAVDTLKIDRAFIRDVTTDKDAAAIVIAILAMANTLGKEVVAEGVETEEQLRFLRERQCEFIQGYFFSPPVGPDDFAKFWHRQSGKSRERGQEPRVELRAGALIR